MIHLDTHVVVWLAGGLSAKVPAAVLRRITEGVPVVSPMVALEVDFLHEIGRIRAGSLEILTHLEATIGLTLAPVAFPAAIAAARSLRWTRDPFDRLIVGSAACLGAPLVTADTTIQQNYPAAVWA